MSFVNEKGGFSKKLAILQNDSSESTTVLRHAFLKKAENYSLQIQDFFLNKMPEIHEYEADADIEIFQYEAYNGNWDGVDERFRKFTARKCYSVIEYIRQLQEFFHRFSNLILTLGYRTRVGGGDTKYMPGFPASLVTRIYGADPGVTLPIYRQQNVNFTKSYAWNDFNNGVYIQRGFGEVIHYDEPTEYDYRGGHIVSASLNTNKKIVIQFTKAFAFNFYLKLSDSFVRRTAFDQYLFKAWIPAIIPENTQLFLPDGVTFSFDLNNRVIPPASFQFGSINTIDSLDERVSIDIVSVFPTSSKIESLDETESHEILLGRFPLKESISFRNTEKSDVSGSVNQSEISEIFVSGMRNLTSHNPYFESNHFLNGDIRQIIIQLYTRYWNRETKKFRRVQTDCQDACWILNLLFSKKL